MHKRPRVEWSWCLPSIPGRRREGGRVADACEKYGSYGRAHSAIALGPNLPVLTAVLSSDHSSHNCSAAICCCSSGTHALLCTVCNALSTLNSAQCAGCIAQCTVYSAQCTVCTLWTALTRAGYWLPALRMRPKYQIPHLQVAPNLPPSITGGKKVPQMPGINLEMLHFHPTLSIISRESFFQRYFSPNIGLIGFGLTEEQLQNWFLLPKISKKKMSFVSQRCEKLTWVWGFTSWKQKTEVFSVELSSTCHQRVHQRVHCRVGRWHIPWEAPTHPGHQAPQPLSVWHLERNVLMLTALVTHTYDLKPPAKASFLC